MRSIINAIQTAVSSVDSAASFIHGRSFDSALDTHINSTEVAYVFLDPITKTGTISDRKETQSISLGFIKQDAPDSSVEQMQQIIEDMENFCLDTLQVLFDMNVLDDGMIVQFDSYSLSPVYRLKNVCTGVLCTFSLVASRPC